MSYQLKNQRKSKILRTHLCHAKLLINVFVGSKKSVDLFVVKLNLNFIPFSHFKLTVNKNIGEIGRDLRNCFREKILCLYL